MTNKNIWENLNFSENEEPSAYDYLLEQDDLLVKATSGVLKINVEAIDSYLESEDNSLKPVALYMLYVVAPLLGNFRRKILTVMEGKNNKRFPVDIYCHIDNEKNENVIESDFLDTISAILAKPLVRISIENLYKQSKEAEKSKLA